MRSVQAMFGALCVSTCTLWAVAQDFADEVGQNAGPQGMREVAPGVFAPDVEPRLLDAGIVEPFQASTPEEVRALIAQAYNRVAYDLFAEDDEHDGVLRPANLEAWVRQSVNPGGVVLFPEEEALLRERLEEFARHEGLVHGHVKLHIGYLNRGAPFHFIQRLTRDLKALRVQITGQKEEEVIEDRRNRRNRRNRGDNWDDL